MCYNDQIAYGVIDLLQKHNVRVPEDAVSYTHLTMSLPKNSTARPTAP